MPRPLRRPRPKAPSPAIAVLATLGAAGLWGTSFNVNDLGLAHIEPATFVVLRFAMAGALALSAAWWLGRLDASVARDPWMWGLAIANGGGFLLQYLGQTLTTPARTALFVNTSAFFVALLERALFRTRFGPRRVLAILAGFVGATLLVTGGDIGSLGGWRLLGDAATLAAGFGWSIYTILNSRAVRESDPLNVVAWTFTLTSVVLLPALLLDDAPLRVAPGGWLPLLYTGVVTTAAAYGLWAYGLRTIRPSTSTVLLLAEILVASTLSVAILRRETFGPWEFGGAILLFSAVALMTWLSSKEQEPQDHPKDPPPEREPPEPDGG